ncbi:hypothetical protein J3998_12365 [Thiomicrorhabdus sp. 6S2-11]|uniref:Lipoprotein n=1 Tax=Thiomicrorhabdus marina TaxID=2818442 RepID=A0ABS3Q7T9_9GAMM|nr:hypothetical protein [Thiomicrorhabdus marina]MBO1928367.1 hypothetical protein [Thiomicrorhabdus marina]
MNVNNNLTIQRVLFSLTSSLLIAGFFSVSEVHANETNKFFNSSFCSNETCKKLIQTVNSIEVKSGVIELVRFDKGIKKDGWHLGLDFKQALNLSDDSHHISGPVKFKMFYKIDY